MQADREFAALEREAEELEALVAEAEAGGEVASGQQLESTWTLVRLQQFLTGLRTDADREAELVLDAARQAARVRIDGATAEAERRRRDRRPGVSSRFRYVSLDPTFDPSAVPPDAGVDSLVAPRAGAPAPEVGAADSAPADVPGAHHPAGPIPPIEPLVPAAAVTVAPRVPPGPASDPVSSPPPGPPPPPAPSPATTMPAPIPPTLAPAPVPPTMAPAPVAPAPVPAPVAPPAPEVTAPHDLTPRDPAPPDPAPAAASSAQLFATPRPDDVFWAEPAAAARQPRLRMLPLSALLEVAAVVLILLFILLRLS
jgi:hypothetical protein